MVNVRFGRTKRVYCYIYYLFLYCSSKDEHYVIETCAIWFGDHMEPTQGKPTQKGDLTNPAY